MEKSCIVPIVLMQIDTDCEVAATATATGKSYDDVKQAINHTELPYGLENPVYGNPWNLYRALISLGYWKKNITLTELLNGVAEPIKTIILIHDPKAPILNQHWVNYAGLNKNGMVGYYDGKSPIPVYVSRERFKDLFLKGWPNCAFQVYKASAWRVMLEKCKLYFEKLYKKCYSIIKK